MTAMSALAGGRSCHFAGQIHLQGRAQLGGEVFRCWNQYGHGKVSLHRAIVESCDVYFYELGLKLGPERIAHYAPLLGLGTPTGLGLPQELPGLIPTPPWKLRTYGDSWKDGETLNIAIGQGYLVSTPLQLAMMTAALANGGKILRPALVRQIVSQDGDIIFDHSPVVRWTLPLKQEKPGRTPVRHDRRGCGQERNGPEVPNTRHNDQGQRGPPRL